MPSARILNDGLWHCLCPSFEFQLLTRPHRARSLKTNPRNGCTSSWRCPVSNTIPTRALTIRTYPHSGEPRKSRNGDSHDRDHFFTQRSPSVGVSHAPKPPPSTAIQLYEKLRSVSFKGNHDEIEGIVGVLVRDFHERPNIRLYNALILSNIDPVNGSAAKAAGLFREISKEGIIPESGTYHALLKVC